MTQTSIAYHELRIGDQITFQTADNGFAGTGNFIIRTGIVKSIGPKAAIVVSAPGTPTWRAMIREATWYDRQVRREEPVSVPLEVDTALAAIYKRRSEATRALARAIDEAHRCVGDRKTMGTRKNFVSQWKRSDGDVENELRERALSEAPTPWDLYDRAKTVSRINSARAELSQCDTEQKPLDATYAAAPWSRFFLVTSSHGHIHRSMSCSTCRVETEFGWLPELSGLAEADAVAAHGPLLCSVCFPTAPTEWTIGRPKAEHCMGTPDPNEKSRRVGMNTYHKCTCGYVAIVNSNGTLRKHKP